MSHLHPIGTWIDPASGDLLDHGALMDRIATQQAVLLGETHDRYDIHQWQLHVLVALHARTPRLVLGFEMFPRRCQPVLDEWVAGGLDRARFIEKVEWQSVWGFPPALYLPIFDFCRQFRVPMKALNCRRALVTEVGKLGWDAIAIADRDGVTPAAPSLPGHRQYLFDLTGGARRDRAAVSADDPSFDRFVRAQSTWDRAFACGIADAYAEGAPLVVGLIGRGHMEYGHGTPFQLADLGLSDVAVLLTSDQPLNPSADLPIAESVFHLEPPAIRSLMPSASLQPLRQ